MARRIQLRAYDRVGELLRQIEPARGANQNIQEGDLPNVTRESAATEAGLSEHERKTALRINSIDRNELEGLIESDEPPTIWRRPRIGFAGAADPSPRLASKTARFC
ncbi:MAG TPA: hypothetical protein VHT00_01270 [Stellaceae bacterium]|nr:hypothetical protein [Stellaceae bacterium]